MTTQTGLGEVVAAFKVMLTIGYRDDLTALGNQVGGTQVGLLQQGLTIR
jgi:hypothetical protein